MKKILLLFIFTTFAFSTKAQSPTFQWAKGMGGASFEDSHSIAVDASGNVYTCGTFYTTSDFDPGSGTYTLTSSGLFDIFISKLDASGNFAWVKQIGSTQTNEGLDIALDISGNIYITGYFYGTADFDPGSGIFNLSSAGNTDLFILKLDSSGNFVWAKNTGGAEYDRGNSIAVDTQGNVYTTGCFEGTADFDPSAGINNLTAAGLFDIFISKLDASGNFMWAKNIGGATGDYFFYTAADNANSITLDASGNVYTTGYFSGIADLDPGASIFTLNGGLYGSMFISKLNTNGNFVWAKKIGTESVGHSIAIDRSGNIYSTGCFAGSPQDFDPGPGIYNLPWFGVYDIFISKLDSSGNFVWAKSIGSLNVHDIGHSIAIDISGNIYITGEVNFWYPDKDIFIAKLDANGIILWTEVMGSEGSSIGNAIAVDECGAVYTTGTFSNTVNFNPDSTTTNLTSTGLMDVYVLKLEQLPVAPNTVTVMNDTVCSGKPMVLNVTGGSLGATASWEWYLDSCGGLLTGAGSSILITPDKPMTYYVRAENSCMVTECASITVHVKTNPTASFETKLSPTCKGVTAELINTSKNAHSYLWNSHNGSSSTQTNESYFFEYGSMGATSLISINNNGCRDTFLLQQKIGELPDFLDIRLPNIFTPNNDGINDNYKVNVKADVSDCFSINIFNRWGETLFTSFDPKFEWDGKIQSGTKAIVGTYFYIIEIKKEQYKGNITLLE